MSESYEDILNRGWDEVPEPKTLPEGNWLLKGRNASFQPAKGGGNHSALFVYAAKEPLDDVDQGALDALGPDYDYGMNQIFFRVWIENDADWDKVRKHLAKHGVEAAGTIAEGLKAFKGTEVVATLGVRTFMSKAGDEVVENNPTNFVPLD